MVREATKEKEGSLNIIRRKGSALLMGVSAEGLISMMEKVRRTIMKLLLFEDCYSNSLHLLLSRSVFSAPDRLSEQRDERDSLV